MKLSAATLDYFTGLITGDTKKTIYKSGPQLVQFFNSFGESDVYGQGFPARAVFTREKLNKFNNTDVLSQILEQSIHPANILTTEITKTEILSEANDFLAYDGFVFVETNRGVRIKELSDMPKKINNNDNPFKVDSFKLFISHKDNYKSTANKLKISLEIYGISSFVAHEDIEPTKEWQNEIEKALFSMDALLALLSKGFSESVWTNQEVGVAFGRESFILAVRSGEDPKGFVGKFQALRSKNSDIDSLSQKIAVQLISNPKTSEKMKIAYISALKNTSQYAETEKWLNLLDSIESLSKDQINQLIENYNSNSQAYDCFSLNGGKYGNKKKISSYLNEWTGSDKYKLVNNKIKKNANA